jgi:hypothetical protein
MESGLKSGLGVSPGKPRVQTERKVDALKQLTERIIGCAIEVHRQLGPGLLEGTYESALCIELNSAGLQNVRQPNIPGYV